MSNKHIIDIGIKIDIDDLAENKAMIQANSGGGKSNIAKIIIEKSYKIIPSIIMDIEGEYWPLKEVCPEFLVLGGAGADGPLTMEMAGSLPKFIIENGLCVVLDLSDFKMNQRVIFAGNFADALMELPQKYWTSYLIWLEECHRLAGEQDKQPSSAAIRELMGGGRKRGFTGIPITQRIAKLHKDVAAECNNKFVGRTILDIDMDRAARELGFSSSSEYTRTDLRTLNRDEGEFFVYGTSIQPQHVHKVRIKQCKSRTVKKGKFVAVKARKPTGALLEALAKLAELPSHKGARKAVTTNPVPSVTNAENPKLQAELIQVRKDLADEKKLTFRLREFGLRLTNIICGAGTKALTDPDAILLTSASMDAAKKNLTSDLTLQAGRITPPVSITNRKANQKEEKAVLSTGLSAGDKLPKGEETVLRSVASYEAGLARKSITVITGYSRRTRDSYIQGLKVKGLVDQHGDLIQATGAGIEHLGPNFQPLPSGRELFEYWMRELPAGEKAILEYMGQHYPNIVTRDQVSGGTGYTRRTRDAYLMNMIHKEIVAVAGKGAVKLSELLFD